MRSFLTEIKLDKYYEKFIENGVEDLETILELKDEHIEQMGIPLGHNLKIIKKIKDLRTQKGMSVPQSRQGTRREVLNNKGNQADEDTAAAEPSTQSNSNSQGRLSTQPSSLKNGQYDENASHE